MTIKNIMRVQRKNIFLLTKINNTLQRTELTIELNQSHVF